MSNRNRAIDMRNQVIKMTILTALVSISLFGALDAIVTETWWLAPLFSLLLVQAIYQLNLATEGYLFLKRIAGEG